MSQQNPPRGLPAIQKLRDDRHRGKFSRPTAAMFFYGALAVVGCLAAHYFVSSRGLGEAKGRLAAKQRATEQELGARWNPLRAGIETSVLGAAVRFEGDNLEPELKRWDFRAMPGIYLRMRVADARDPASLRRAAQESARDAFVGLLLKNPPASDGGAFPDQPWNLRQAYLSTRVLTPEWVQAVKDADDELRLSVFEQQYAKAVEHEIPLAIDIVTRARFLLLVLDEDVAEAGALARERDAGVVTLEMLQLVPHPSRVHVFDLRRGAEVLRLRRTGHASFIMSGDGDAVSAETRDAMQRQVNNADLARQAREAIDDAK